MNPLAVLIHHLARLLDHVRACHCNSLTAPAAIEALYKAEAALYDAMDALGYNARQHRL